MDVRIAELDEETYLRHLRKTTKEDSFTRTFYSKTKMSGLWKKSNASARCILEDEVPVAAAITTFTKRKTEPWYARLQLIVTLSAHRKKGYGKRLIEDSISKSLSEGCTYYFVSAEKSAVGFYESLGFRFLGRQKSGCYLSVMKLDEWDKPIRELLLAPVIRKVVYSGRKGSCVEVFPNGRCG